MTGTTIFVQNLKEGDQLSTLQEVTEVRVIGQMVWVFTKGSQFALPTFSWVNITN